jgi:hypothetical protein
LLILLASLLVEKGSLSTLKPRFLHHALYVRYVFIDSFCPHLQIRPTFFANRQFQPIDRPLTFYQSSGSLQRSDPASPQAKIAVFPERLPIECRSVALRLTNAPSPEWTRDRRAPLMRRAAGSLKDSCLDPDAAAAKLASSHRVRLSKLCSSSICLPSTLLAPHSFSLVPGPSGRS